MYLISFFKKKFSKERAVLTGNASNECDMLNRIVVGMSAKQFRLANDIEKGKSIRPYLSDGQIQMLEILQKVDVGLLVAVPDYEQRKRYLEWYKQKLEGGEI